jgi:hypothetical protein
MYSKYEGDNTNFKLDSQEVTETMKWILSFNSKLITYLVVWQRHCVKKSVFQIGKNSLKHLHFVSWAIFILSNW